MIVRRGTNVQYTHDEEALVAELMRRRPFGGVSHSQMVEWISPLREYSYSADYVTDANVEIFFAYNTFNAVMAKRNGARVVTLWRVYDTALRIIEDHGFSCTICGTHCDYEARGKFYDWTVELAVRDRQGIAAPPLACRECAIDVPAMMSRWISDRNRLRAVDRLIDRCMAT